MTQRAGNNSRLFGVPVRKEAVATRAFAAAAADLAATSLLARAPHQGGEALRGPPHTGARAPWLHRANSRPWTPKRDRGRFSSHLKRWRLQRAAALLRDDALTLSSVAKRVDYESTAAFSRAFTRLFGVSSGRYRGSVGRTAGGTAREYVEDLPNAASNGRSTPAMMSGKTTSNPGSMNLVLITDRPGQGPSAPRWREQAALA
jgi:AraC-like DNA-binding protein